jgi:phosphopantetheinyl transferase (holo-ACP synthase)
MPLFYQQDINETTRLGVWKIEESPDFFLEQVPVHRGITHPHKRIQHLAGRYLLRQLFPGFPMEMIMVADTRKPFLEDESFHFSISHCGDYAAALVSRTKRVGVDVEMITPRIHRVLPKFLHPDERERIQFNIEKTATLIWSVKESVFKWYGLGEIDFSEHIRTGSFDMGEMGAVPVLFCKDGRKELEAHYRFFGDLVLSWIIDSSH